MTTLYCVYIGESFVAKRDEQEEVNRRRNGETFLPFPLSRGGDNPVAIDFRYGMDNYTDETE